MSDVLKSFQKELPKEDEFQKVVSGLPIIKKLIETGYTVEKVREGFIG